METTGTASSYSRPCKPSQNLKNPCNIRSRRPLFKPLRILGYLDAKEPTGFLIMISLQKVCYLGLWQGLGYPELRVSLQSVEFLSFRRSRDASSDSEALSVGLNASTSTWSLWVGIFGLITSVMPILSMLEMFRNSFQGWIWDVYGFLSKSLL